MRILLAMAILTAACSGANEEAGEAVYTLDLAAYSPGQTPAALKIANETVVFPLGVGPREQALTGAAPGDLVALYTRVGCAVEPEEWIGTNGAVPAHIPATAPVHLVAVTVDELSDGGTSPRGLADGTCVSVRWRDGTWHPSARPSQVTVEGVSVRAEFALDVESATAAAIFLPTYTYVSRVSYRMARE
jgi:hypothetical protein